MERVAFLHQFPLPGGDKAVKEPARAAMGLLYTVFGEEVLAMPNIIPLQSYSSKEKSLILQAIAKGINAPMTSSAGRLFDGVASLMGVRQKNSFEGQAAIELEHLAEKCQTEETYSISRTKNLSEIADWRPMLRDILRDLRTNVAREVISARFHNTLVEIVIAIAEQIGEERVVLSGGCFQNKILSERMITRLQVAGFRPYYHQRVPPNDGGLALGQVYSALIQSSRS